LSPVAVLGRLAVAMAVAVVGSVMTATIPAAAANPPGKVNYVALGDSYAAGVGGGTETTECRRTEGAYAQRWAARKPDSVALTVAACSGATSLDVMANQLASLGPNTDLVSITIGGNDLELFSAMRVCADPQQAAACTARIDAINDAMVNTLPARVGKLLAAMAARAPKAKLVVAGYPLVFTDVAECPAFAVSKTLRDTANTVLTALNGVLAAQAKLVSATYVDIAAAFAGHGLCSTEPWIVGMEGLNQNTILHPSPRGYNDGYAAAIRGGVGSVDDVLRWIAQRDSPAPSTGPSTPTASPSGVPGSGSAGGGGLPITGVNIGWTVGAGLTLVVAGAIILFLSRRRTRPTR
jgi:lysophospholipase L1-like esterase